MFSIKVRDACYESVKLMLPLKFHILFLNSYDYAGSIDIENNDLSYFI